MIRRAGPIQGLFSYEMVAGTTDKITFKVRAGGGNGSTTTTFNGQNDTAFYNNNLASSITVTEIAS